MIRQLIKSLLDNPHAAVVHYIAPVAAMALDPILALSTTLLFIFYQVIDYASGEPAAETQTDLVEWMMGLFIGAVLRLLYIY